MTMDVTIVNVALPAIREHLHASTSQLQWSIDGYTVVLASFLILAGSVADRVGRKKVFMVGIALFSAGSLLCGLSWTPTALIGFRALQALGGSMLNPVAMSIITNTFTDKKKRASAIGVWGAVVGISMAVGPALGGLLVEHVSWRAIFWVNVPIGILAFALTWFFIPDSRAEHARKFDLGGQALSIGTLGFLITALIEGPEHGWISLLNLGLLSAFAACLVGTIYYELRQKEPLIDMHFFKSVPFTSATIIAVFAFMNLSGFLFLTSLFLQDTLHFSAMKTGFCLLPTAVTVLICSPLSGRLVGSGHVRATLVLAGFAYSLGAFLILRSQSADAVAILLIAYAFIGIGAGLVNTPITNAAVSGLPDSQAGVAAALASTSRQIGSSLGVAIIGSFMKGATPSSNGSAYWWVVVGSGLVIAAMGVFSTRTSK